MLAFQPEDIAHALPGLRLAASVFPLAEDSPLAGAHANEQRQVNVVVNALVARTYTLLEVISLHQIAVAPRVERPMQTLTFYRRKSRHCGSCERR